MTAKDMERDLLVRSERAAREGITATRREAYRALTRRWLDARGLPHPPYLNSGQGSLR